MDDKLLQDITTIKTMMSKSTQFISLSGLAGIMAGIYALIGAFFAQTYLEEFYYNLFIQSGSKKISFIANELIYNLWIIAVLVLSLSIITSIILSLRKAKMQHENIWSNSSKRLLLNFLIPLATGGIFGLILLKNEYYELIAPITLIFYGMACLNASKYTLRDIRYLGLTVTILGLLNTYFLGYGLHFWSLGFGVCHILYGSIMYFKYDRN